MSDQVVGHLHAQSEITAAGDNDKCRIDKTMLSPSSSSVAAAAFYYA